MTTYKISGGGPSTAGCCVALIVGVVLALALLVGTVGVVR